MWISGKNFTQTFEKNKKRCYNKHKMVYYGEKCPYEGDAYNIG